LPRREDYWSSLEKSLKHFCSKGRTRFYLSEFAEENRISIIQAEDFFLHLLKANQVEGTLEVRCPRCGRDQGIFKKFLEMPEEFTCEICGYQFPADFSCTEIILEVKGDFFRTQSYASNSNRKNSIKNRS